MAAAAGGARVALAACGALELLPLPRPHDEVAQGGEVGVPGLRREGVAPRVGAEVDGVPRVEGGVGRADHRPRRLVLDAVLLLHLAEGGGVERVELDALVLERLAHLCTGDVGGVGGMRGM